MLLNNLFRLLLTFNATALLVIIFLVQKGFTLQDLFSYLDISKWMPTFPNAISYILYVSVILLLTKLSILVSTKLGKDPFRSGEIVSIEYANNSFLPSYLGYFFVALSIGNWETLWFVYMLLFVFTFYSQALYFNPLFLVFGYNFYNVTTKNGTVLFLISQNNFKNPKYIDTEAYRINNYTFIEHNFIDRGK
ncbi:hypothetical protein [Psychrobacter sp. JB385]|uniref:hypothetical protein n=1 Tax=Psychrobacter sp. JB385 TaxID=1434841 RepID=UPI00097F455A|nr:hypothetical protein [Psychrobacter sp. JB385]SJN19112.1 hypothetical protein CZ794_02165 [Psychrobacter sp. JB385]